MLLSDTMHPQSCIYYTGSIILEKLETHNNKTLIDLFGAIKETEKMSFNVFILSLDWLYLLDMVLVNEKGIVTKCF